MPLFYAKQTDYLTVLNLIGSKYSKGTFTCSTTSTKTIDLSGNHTSVLNMTSASPITITLDVSNKPSAIVPIELVIYVNYTFSAVANVIVWPVTTRWPAGASAPTLTNTAGKTDIFILRSPDGGTTFYGDNISLANYTT